MQGSPIISGGGAGRGEWQAIQQAPSVGQTPSQVPFQPQPGQVPFQAQPSQVPFQAQPGQVPFQPQPGQFPFQGQGTQFHGYAGGGYPRAPGAGGMQRPPQAGGVAGGRGYPSPQQFMTPQQRQQLHQQVSLSVCTLQSYWTAFLCTSSNLPVQYQCYFIPSPPPPNPQNQGTKHFL